MAAEALDMRLNWRAGAAVWAALVLMLIAAFLGYYLTPRHYAADDRPAMHLAEVVPSSFGEWRVDPAQAPLLVDPSVQQKLDALYTQTLNRTYVNGRGERVLLSIAYGRNQNTESTAAHRPEFCYGAQGFVVAQNGMTEIALAGHQIKAIRLDARMGERREPITYWVTLGDEASLPGFSRKLHQLKYGLQGQIVDGMLMRVSTLRSASDPSPLDAEYATQERFLREMEQALPGVSRARFFGS